MRVIVEAFSRVWLLEFQSAKSDDHDRKQPEEFDAAPVDPHSAVGALVERGPGADSYVSDVVARRFGFHGSQG